MNTRLTKIEIFAESILQNFPDLGQWQAVFMRHILVHWLRIRGRYNFVNLARYGSQNESTYRNNFARFFDWLEFNSRVCRRVQSTHRLIALDPTYIVKSGKHTEGVGRFWSGCAAQVKPGLEFTGLASVDLSTKKALHLLAVQTAELEPDETLLEYYASLISLNKSALLNLSRYVAVDAYFSRKPFVDRVLHDGFDLVTRLRSDQSMRYLYTGPHPKRRGRKRKFDGKVNVRELREDVFVCCAEDEQQTWRAFEAVLNVKALKREVLVVVVQHYDSQGKIARCYIYMSTDINLSGGEVLYMYQCRYQQEFLYRDAKQELGLEQCQAYSYEKNEFHINCALTVGSLAKAAHYLDAQADHHPDAAFSIADIKTEYFNEYQAVRIIEGCGINANEPKIIELIRDIKQWGKRAA